MPVADTARLLAELDFVDKLSPGVKSATNSLGGLQKSTKQTELELAKLALAQEQAAAKASGTLTAQSKAAFAQRKAVLDAGIAQEKYQAALSKASRATQTAEQASGRYVGTLGRIKGQLGGLSKGDLANSVLTGAGIGGGILAFNGLSTAVSGVTQVMSGSIAKASDLNESISKSQAVFGDASREIEKWSETAATSMGQSRQEAIEAAATFGNLFKSMGLAEEQLAPMSEGLVQLAADLASFNNQDPSEVLMALRSGLVGEVEPMRRFGVALSQVSVEAEAARLGFKKVNGQFEQSALIQARYSLILQQTKTAQGDFARTSSQLANTQRTLNAEWEDAQAALGQKLLPVMLELAHFTRDVVVPGFTLLLDNTDKLTPIAEGLAFVLAAKLTVSLAQSATGFLNASTQALAFAASETAVGTAATETAAVSTAAAEASGVAWKSALGPMVAGLLALQQIHDLVGSFAPPDMQKNLLPEPKKGLLPNPFEGYTFGVEGATRDTDKLNASLSTVEATAADARAKFDLSAVGVHNLSLTIGALDTTAGKAGPEVRARMLMAKSGVDEFAGSSPGLLEIAKAMRAPIEAARAMRTGVDGEFQQLLTDFDHFKSNTGRIAEITGQLLNKKFRKAIHDGRPDVKAEAQAYQLDALYELQKLVEAGGKVGKDGMRALEQAMKSENPEVASVAALIRNTVTRHLPNRGDGSHSGHAVGGGVVSAVQTETQRAARAAAAMRAAIQKNLPSHISTTIDVAVHYFGDSRSGFRALGGPVLPGHKYTVGEDGPETLILGPTGGGYVIPRVGAAPQMTMPYPNAFSAPQIASRPQMPLYLNLAPVVQASVSARDVVLQPAVSRRYGPLVPNDV